MYKIEEQICPQSSWACISVQAIYKLSKKTHYSKAWARQSFGVIIVVRPANLTDKVIHAGAGHASNVHFSRQSLVIQPNWLVASRN